MSEQEQAKEEIMKDYKEGSDKVYEAFKEANQGLAKRTIIVHDNEALSLTAKTGIFGTVAGLLGGILIGYLIFSKPAEPPPLFNVSIHRPDKYPLVLHITKQEDANWFLPNGTNPVVVTRISLDRPTSK